VNIVAKRVNSKRMTGMGVLLHWTQANSFELVERQNHWRPQGVETGANTRGEIALLKPTN